MDIRHRGTFRTDYEADWARLDDFQVLTAEADKLLHRLIRASREIPYHNADGQEVILVSFLERHVLTVLADIARKKLSNYGNSFANVQGTAIQAAYTQKLRQDINRWIARLDSYLHNTWQAGNNSSPAAETARWLKDRLEQSLSADELDGNNNYYRDASHRDRYSGECRLLPESNKGQWRYESGTILVHCLSEKLWQHC